jgi:hypothetical protein
MRWDDIDKQICSVARALSVVGERWTMLILRDAFLGTRRFDQFQSNLGITRHRLAERLGKLVEQGVLVMSLARWGDEWMDKGQGAPLEYVHLTCGNKTRPTLTCSECGETLRPEGVRPQLGPALRDIDSSHEGASLRDIPALAKGSRNQL